MPPPPLALYAAQGTDALSTDERNVRLQSFVGVAALTKSRIDADSQFGIL